MGFTCGSAKKKVLNHFIFYHGGDDECGEDEHSEGECGEEKHDEDTEHP